MSENSLPMCRLCGGEPVERHRQPLDFLPEDRPVRCSGAGSGCEMRPLWFTKERWRLLMSEPPLPESAVAVLRALAAVENPPVSEGHTTVSGLMQEKEAAYYRAVREYRAAIDAWVADGKPGLPQEPRG